MIFHERLPVLSEDPHASLMKITASFQYGCANRIDGHMLSDPCRSLCKAMNLTNAASSWFVHGEGLTFCLDKNINEELPSISFGAN